MEKFEHLHDLDYPNRDLSSIWALMPPLPPEPRPALPGLVQFPGDDNKREGRGSQFTKFMAKHGTFTSSNKVEKGKPHPDGIIRGRL